jgi:predicted lipoprotein with Yx(FWY)xxD motif
MANSPVGNALVGPNGKTLYILTKDVGGVSTCYGDCAVAWPPLLTDVRPQADKGVAGGILGTAKRTDGSLQVTYNGRPLYYWFKDNAAGEWNGQGIGKVWWVMAPFGSPIARPLPAYAKLSMGPTLYGPILVGTHGRTVYILTHDTNGQSVCYSQCATIWPPVLTDKAVAPFVGTGIDGKLIGTVQRKDGTMQVTFKGMPLYYFFDDKAPGELKGQNTNSVWFVLRPSGKVLMPGDQSAP